MLKKVLTALGITASLAVFSCFLYSLFVKYLLEPIVLLIVWVMFILTAA